ncbi:MAG: transporter, partial [Bacteroidaceae bacterium]|nr:transporter [Bacteroidaceae bacterium]
MKILEFMRNWTLPISMGTGVASYFILSEAECLRPYRPYMSEAVDALQPILIFSMLFLSFCKIKPKELKLVPWQWKLLCLQGGTFMALGGLLALMPEAEWRILV